MEVVGQQVVHVPVAVVDEDVRRAGRQRTLDRGVRLGDHQVDGDWVAPIRGIGGGGMIDAPDPFHVDADIDPHAASSGPAVGPVRAGSPIHT